MPKRTQLNPESSKEKMSALKHEKFCETNFATIKFVLCCLKILQKNALMKEDGLMISSLYSF